MSMFADVLEDFEDGEPIRRESWEKNQFLYYDKEDGFFVTFIANSDRIVRQTWRNKIPNFKMDDYTCDDWSAYEWESIGRRLARRL